MAWVASNWGAPGNEILRTSPSRNVNVSLFDWRAGLVAAGLDDPASEATPWQPVENKTMAKAHAPKAKGMQRRSRDCLDVVEADFMEDGQGLGAVRGFDLNELNLPLKPQQAQTRAAGRGQVNPDALCKSCLMDRSWATDRPPRQRKNTEPQAQPDPFSVFIL